LAAALAAAALLGGLLVAFLVRVAPMGTGFQAKVLCAGVFHAGREASEVLATDLDPGELSVLLRLCSAQVDTSQRRVRSTFLGGFESEAIHRPGVGTTVVVGDLAPVAAAAPLPVASDPQALWPEGERVDLEALPAEVRGLNAGRLAAAMDAAFSEPDPQRPRRTRAVVVVWRGRIVAERYATGFGPQTPQLGWSMTKTVVGALVGVMVREGRWALDAPLPVPEWGGDDARAGITLRQLLQMQSGLEFAEVYSPLTDVTVMLFEEHDTGAYAANKPLAHPPGTAWSYSSGTSNVICRAMREELGADAYAEFPRRALFGPLGMRSATIDVDSAGTFVGSSFGWATARDWARFGLLWVQDGVWGGQRILPEGWVDLCRQPAEHSGGQYGGHVWLKLRTDGDAPSLPADTFHAAGHDRQLITMIPSRELVVVRLGLTRHGESWVQERFVADVLEALPE
jgi:CubicO group peptidase (beta-lactamase class C family)